MWLGERDDDQANPVSIGIYRDGVGINFDLVRDKRTPNESSASPTSCERSPESPATSSGSRTRTGMHRGMKAEEVLGSDDALEAWKKVLNDASAPA